MDRPFVVARIPAYSEESSIGAVMIRTREYVDRVLVCDDGSVDYLGCSFFETNFSIKNVKSFRCYGR